MSEARCVGCGHLFTWLDDTGLCYTCQRSAGKVKIKVGKQETYSNCRMCGASLRGLKLGAQFCSSACKQKFHRAEKRSKEHICEWCDQQFTSSRKDAHYCSPACKQAAHRLRKNRGAVIINYAVPIVRVESEE